MTQPPNKRKPGRPAGATNQDYDAADAIKSRCRVCGSTDRAPYTRTLATDASGMKDGRPFDRVVRRWTKCQNCGQARIDYTWEYAGDPIDAGE